jgi:hypothetical protein
MKLKHLVLLFGAIAQMGCGDAYQRPKATSRAEDLSKLSNEELAKRLTSSFTKDNHSSDQKMVGRFQLLLGEYRLAGTSVGQRNNVAGVFRIDTATGQTSVLVDGGAEGRSSPHWQLVGEGQRANPNDPGKQSVSDSKPGSQE